MPSPSSFLAALPLGTWLHTDRVSQELTGTPLRWDASSIPVIRRSPLASPDLPTVGGTRVTMTLFCLLVVTVVVPAVGLLADLDRASTVRTLAAAQAALRRAEEAP
jgi:hypothetical protein